MPASDDLIALTDAVILRDAYELDAARTAVSEALGVASTVRAIAVAANFQMMNIIMDTLGTPPHVSVRSLADDIGIKLPDY